MRNRAGANAGPIAPRWFAAPDEQPMRPSVRAIEVLTEIRRRGNVSLSVLVSQFAGGRDEQDVTAVIHALARARLVEISSQSHGDIVTLTDDGTAVLHREARRRD